MSPIQPQDPVLPPDHPDPYPQTYPTLPPAFPQTLYASHPSYNEEELFAFEKLEQVVAAGQEEAGKTVVIGVYALVQIIKRKLVAVQA